MTPEQKQQAKQLIADWTNVSRTSTPAVWFLNGDCMAGFLQELVDAPEPEPVGYTNETELDYVRTYEALPVSGAFWPTSDEDACVALYTAPPANNQSEQHLEMVNAPAPSVPDDFYNAVANLSVELEELVAETSGVYGLHLNGDPSPWEEILEGGRFERISSLHVVQNLLATRQPKQPEQPAQPAELVRDAERYRWLRDSVGEHWDVAIRALVGVGAPAEVDAAIDAAIEREKKGGAA